MGQARTDCILAFLLTLCSKQACGLFQCWAKSELCLPFAQSYILCERVEDLCTDVLQIFIWNWCISDAERVLRFPRQYLLGNQDDIIELQRHKQYQDSILIRSECDIPSTEALKYIFNKKFGPVLYCSRYRNRRDIFVLKFGYENAIACKWHGSIPFI